MFGDKCIRGVKIIRGCLVMKRKFFVPTLFVMLFTFLVFNNQVNANSNFEYSLENDLLSTSPAAIEWVYVDVTFNGPYKYVQIARPYGIYRGYLQYDYSALNVHRYSGMLYREDLPYPIPYNDQLIEQ